MRHAGKPLGSKPIKACLLLPLLPQELLAALLLGGCNHMERSERRSEEEGIGVTVSCQSRPLQVHGILCPNHEPALALQQGLESAHQERC
jgi:hypothetical protein